MVSEFVTLFPGFEEAGPASELSYGWAVSPASPASVLTMTQIEDGDLARMDHFAALDLVVENAKIQAALLLLLE